MDIVQKSGAWFSYNGERLGQGRENAKQYLKDHPDVAEVIEREVRNASSLSEAAVTAASLGGEQEDDEDIEKELF